jgi:hypothetical protein
MSLSVVASEANGARPRKLDGAGSHRFLRESAGLRDFLHDVAVAVTAGEIHPGVRRARVGAQGLIDDAHGLDERAPVHRPEIAKTTDAVADGDLLGSLLLVARVHQLLDA